MTQARIVEVSGRGRTQISDILNGKITEAPDWTVVEKIVTACLAYASDEGRLVPPDLGDLEDWRRRYFDLEQDLDARARLVGGSSAKRTVGVSSSQAGSRLRTGYIEQVKLITPPQGLIGREAELRELAAFCSDDEGLAYQWWRADAWAGKSALLSWFVLHPPPDAAVVSFFISGRFLGHDDRTGFIDVMLEQLAALLEQDLPAFLPLAVREGHLLRMIGEAATACRAEGRRLILVVDGLDEDAGVTPGHDTHSIAALLPEVAGPGLRVVVASRPDPPIPGDVPDRHPLRDPAIVHDLSRSEHAAVVRESAERGLRRILRGTPLEQDLLGLVTAAGGGLALADLAELTGRSEYDIRSLLQSITGRIFASRINQWRSDAVYVLAHTELQATASDALGHKRLASHRHRLKAWAGTYLDNSWPADTPEYLLRGYFEMLQACSDIPGVTECARDRERHDRMLDMSGGDVAALTEVEAAQHLLLAQPAPDLATIACLAWHRDELTARNAWIPARLPAVWARLGQPARAEALALSATDPARQSEALAQVAVALAAAAEFDRAEKLARSIPRAGQQSEALAQVAVALAAAAEFDRAEKLARSIPRAGQQSEALAQVAVALAAAAEFDRAEKLARSIPRAGQQSEALAQVAVALATAGHFDRAEKLTQSITDGYWQVKALGSFVGMLAAAYPPYRAEMIAYAVTDPFWRIQAVIRVATALAATGEHNRAEALARSIPDPFWYGQAIISLAAVFAAAGCHERALQAVRSAEEAAQLVTDSRRLAQMRAQLAEIRIASSKDEQDELLPKPATDADRREGQHPPPASAQVPAPAGQRGSGITTPLARLAKQAEALTEAAENLAAAGKHDRATRTANRAEAVVRSTTDPVRQAHALSEVAGILAAIGQSDRAARTAICAVMVARSVPNRTQRAQALTRLAVVLAKSGRYDYAEELIQAIPNPNYREQAAVRLARALMDAGQPSKADALLRSAAIGDTQAYMQRRVAQFIGAAANNDEDDPYELVEFVDPEWRANARTRAAEILVESGALDQAIGPAGTATSPNTKTFIKAAIVLAEAGKYDRAAELAQATGDLEWRGAILAKLAEALAVAGHYDRAEATAMHIGNPPWRARACAHVSEMLAMGGLLDRAESLARSIRWQPWRAEALSHVAEALAAAALPDRAESLAELMQDRTRRARVLSYVAEALGASGKRDRAYQVARRIRDLFPASAQSDEHVQVSAQLVVALEAAGRHNRATEIALSITDPAQQSEALARMIRVLSARGETPAAKRLLATAWAAGPWTTPLAAAALLAPQAIADLADEICESRDRGSP